MIHVATLAEMCEILKIDATTGAKHWRKWPHFFATDGRASNIVGSFMGRNPGVIKTIHDLRRIVQSGKLRGSGCGPKTRVELSEEIEKILAE